MFIAIFLNIPVALRVFSLNIGNIINGSMISWSSPCLLKLDGITDPVNNPLQRPITTQEQAWLASAPVLSATLTCPLPPLLIKHLRRRPTYVLLLLPVIIGYVVMYFGYNIWMLLVGRLLCGVTFGAANQIIPRYAAELSETRNRGAMGSLFSTFVTLGHIFTYSIGPFVKFKVFQGICLVPPIILLLLFAFYLDDSPHDFILTKPEKSKRLLGKLRTKSTEEEVDEEIEEIKILVGSDVQLCLSDFYKIRALRKSLIISMALAVFQHLTGVAVIISYMEHIFTSTKVIATPAIAVICVAMFEFFSTFFSAEIVDRIGRKALLVITQICMILCLVSFAAYNTLFEYNICNLEFFTWVPLVCLVFFMAFFFNGMGVMPYILMGELFPPNAKHISSMITIFAKTFAMLCVTWTFPLLLEKIKLANTFWIFVVSSLLGLVFIFVFIPETKQKSFSEIQNILDK